MATRSGRTTTDHNEIRKWAEARGAKPACVKGTGRGKDPGMIRLDFPGYSGADSLEEISWDQWFKSFDDNGLALVYQEKTAGGARSNFNKLVARETAEARARGDAHASRHHGTSRTSTSTRSRSTTRRSTAQHASGGAEASFKEREYRDSHGEIHHHTHKYMAAHRGSSSKKRSR
ncbi:MAG TPA: hypothetical protein VHB25_20850 [Gemmatimonadaceae bacterium]|nr:hypothetical protein [Gemmatimonadaceae bacterium]